MGYEICNDCKTEDRYRNMCFLSCTTCWNNICGDCINSIDEKSVKMMIDNYINDFPEFYQEEYEKIFNDREYYDEGYEPTYVEIFEELRESLSDYFICRRCTRELQNKEKIKDLEKIINKLKVLLINTKTNKDTLKKIYNYL